MQPVQKINAAVIHLDLEEMVDKCKNPFDFHEIPAEVFARLNIQLIRLTDAVCKDQEAQAVLITNAQVPMSVAAEVNECMKKLRAAGKKVYVHHGLGGAALCSWAAFAPAKRTYLAEYPVFGIEFPASILASQRMSYELQKQYPRVARSRRTACKDFYEVNGRYKISEGACKRRAAKLHRSALEMCSMYESHSQISRTYLNRAQYRIAIPIQEGLELGLFELATERAVEKYLDSRYGKLVKAHEYLRSIPNSAELPKIALISMRGPATPKRCTPCGNGMNAECVEKALAAVRDNPCIQVLVLDINGPGGNALNKVHYTLREIRDAGKRVIVSAGGDMCASAHYKLAMNAYPEKLYVGRLCEIGCIGCILSTGVIKIFQDNGMHLSVLNKNCSVPYSEFSPRHAAEFQQLVEDQYDLFVQEVIAGRKQMGVKAAYSLSTGECYDARTAVANGIADEVGSLQDALDEARRMVNSKTAVAWYTDFNCNPPGMNGVMVSVSSATNVNTGGIQGMSLEELINAEQLSNSEQFWERESGINKAFADRNYGVSLLNARNLAYITR